MRAKEFLAERQKLDEFIPILAGIPAATVAVIEAAIGKTAWTMIVAGINAWFLADSIKVIVETIHKNNYDVDQMGWEDWFYLVLGMAGTYWGVKYLAGMKDRIIAAIPASAKEALGNYFKTTFEKKVKEEIAKKAATTAAPKAASTAPKNPNLVDKPFSKDAPVPATPTPGASAFDRMATDLTKTKPKNPNLVDRPYSK
jgi:hypothetical protein